MRNLTRISQVAAKFDLDILAVELMEKKYRKEFFRRVRDRQIKRMLQLYIAGYSVREIAPRFTNARTGRPIDREYCSRLIHDARRQVNKTKSSEKLLDCFGRF